MIFDKKFLELIVVVILVVIVIIFIGMCAYKSSVESFIGDLQQKTIEFVNIVSDTCLTSKKDQAVVYTCSDINPQKWVHNSDKTITNKDSGMCLENAGDKALLKKCNGSDYQQWTTKNGKIISNTGMCVDIPEFNNTNGTPVGMSVCDSSFTQQWKTV
jgi:hypothetical protein